MPLEVINDAQKVLNLGNTNAKKEAPDPKIANNWYGRKVITVVVLATASVLAATAAVVTAIFHAYIIAAICAAAFLTLALSAVLAGRIKLSDSLLDLIKKLTDRVRNLYNQVQELQNKEKQVNPPVTSNKNDKEVIEKQQNEIKRLEREFQELKNQNKEQELKKEIEELKKRATETLNDKEQVQNFEQKIKEKENEIEKLKTQEFQNFTSDDIHLLSILPQNTLDELNLKPEYKEQIEKIKNDRALQMQNANDAPKSQGHQQVNGSNALTQPQQPEIESKLQKRDPEFEELKQKLENALKAKELAEQKVHALENKKIEKPGTPNLVEDLQSNEQVEDHSKETIKVQQQETQPNPANNPHLIENKEPELQQEIEKTKMEPVETKNKFQEAYKKFGERLVTQMPELANANAAALNNLENVKGKFKNLTSSLLGQRKT